jgi:hypothetical protein
MVSCVTSSTADPRRQPASARLRSIADREDRSQRPDAET